MMTATRNESLTKQPTDDRRVISVDGMPDQANIAASLRRAFAAGRQDQAEREFAALLDRIH